jgi:hypothetical protein
MPHMLEKRPIISDFAILLCYGEAIGGFTRKKPEGRIKNFRLPNDTTFAWQKRGILCVRMAFSPEATYYSSIFFLFCRKIAVRSTFCCSISKQFETG